MSYYQDEHARAGTVKLKLVSYDFKPAPCAIRLVWTREIPDLKRFTADLAEMIRQLKELLDASTWQAKIDAVIAVAEHREVAYRKKVDLFLKQMEKRGNSWSSLDD